MPLTPFSKAFGKDALDSDHQEVVNSVTESERDESDKEPDTPKEDEQAGVFGSPFRFPVISLNIFLFIPNNKIKKH